MIKGERGSFRRIETQPATENFVGDLIQGFVFQVGRTRHELERVLGRALRGFRNHRLCLAHAGGEIHFEFVRAHGADDSGPVDGVAGVGAALGVPPMACVGGK